MKITGARVIPIELALAEPLATAHGVVRSRRGALLSLTSAAGACGWGEALPLPGFGCETAAESRRVLARVAAALAGTTHRDVPAALAAVQPLLAGAKAARAAVEVALLDVAAREAGTDVARLLRPQRRSHVATSALLGGSDPDATASAARAAVARGFRTLKLKLTGDDLDAHAERVGAVRAAVGPAPKLRLDAGGAWTRQVARAAVRRLFDHGIELIEQPLAARDVAGMAELRRASPVPIAADEGVGGAASAERLLASAAADVLVLKPAALGGPGVALAIARRAQRAGVGVLVTSFLDSSLGIASALHLAAALPESSYAAGLATAGLLAHDVATPLPIEKGALALPAGVGLGVAPDAAALQRCTNGAVQEFGA